MERKSLLQNLLTGIGSLTKRWFANPYRAIGLSWFQVKLLKHLPDGPLRTRTLLGKSIWFTSPSELIHGLNEIFVDKIYEQALPSDAFILDCGANIGLSVIYLKQHCPNAHIIAFEPDAANFALLNKNVEAFGLQQIELHEAAIWKENTTLQFKSSGSMGSSLQTHASDTGVTVRAVRLKDLLNRPIDFLKIDIEGAEYDVIKDAADCLHQVKRMFLEYHGRYDQNNELLEILQIVNRAGFSFYIREAAPVHPIPFKPNKNGQLPFDVQLNIFCLRD
ncbi:MAG: FkbM family methyltransferase [Bacteroidota bacterium]